MIRAECDVRLSVMRFELKRLLQTFFDLAGNALRQGIYDRNTLRMTPQCLRMVIPGIR